MHAQLQVRNNQRRQHRQHHLGCQHVPAPHFRPRPPHGHEPAVRQSRTDKHLIPAQPQHPGTNQRSRSKPARAHPLQPGTRSEETPQHHRRQHIHGQRTEHHAHREHSPRVLHEPQPHRQHRHQPGRAAQHGIRKPNRTAGNQPCRCRCLHKESHPDGNSQQQHVRGLLDRNSNEEVGQGQQSQHRNTPPLSNRHQLTQSHTAEPVLQHRPHHLLNGHRNSHRNKHPVHAQLQVRNNQRRQHRQHHLGCQHVPAPHFRPRPPHGHEPAVRQSRTDKHLIPAQPQHPGTNQRSRSKPARAHPLQPGTRSEETPQHHRRQHIHGQRTEHHAHREHSPRVLHEPQPHRQHRHQPGRAAQHGIRKPNRTAGTQQVNGQHLVHQYGGNKQGQGPRPHGLPVQTGTFHSRHGQDRHQAGSGAPRADDKVLALHAGRGDSAQDQEGHYQHAQQDGRPQRSVPRVKEPGNKAGQCRRCNRCGGNKRNLPSCNHERDQYQHGRGGERGQAPAAAFEGCCDSCSNCGSGLLAQQENQIDAEESFSANGIIVTAPRRQSRRLERQEQGKDKERGSKIIANLVGQHCQSCRGRDPETVAVDQAFPPRALQEQNGVVAGERQEQDGELPSSQLCGC